jgi:hypothetical protein
MGASEQDVIIITNRRLLQSKFSDIGWQEISEAIEDYRRALEGLGYESRFLLTDELYPPPSGRNVTNRLVAISRSIKDLIKSVHSEHPANYLLILGGPDIVPFYPKADRTEDRDRGILSDSYYVDFDEDEANHRPELAVGRMPDCGAASILANQLRRAISAHLNQDVPVTRTKVGFSTETWSDASRRTYYHIDRTLRTLRFSPPTGIRSTRTNGVTELISGTEFSAGSVLFFNVHGRRDGSEWYGEHQSFIDKRWPILLNSAILSQADLQGSVIFSEACHAAAIQGSTSANNIALAALSRGAIAFFGCTTTCYTELTRRGSGILVLSGIDMVFHTLIRRILLRNDAFGDALVEAKQISGIRDKYDEKNILSLTLLGDPMLRLRHQS